MKRPVWLIVTLLIFAGGTSLAQTSAFTYQGRLIDTSINANGRYDFTCSLFDAMVNGTQLGSDVAVNDVAVSSGVFTINLDFGFAALSSGSPRFLQISVRHAGTGAYTTLGPRQPVTSAPYSIKASNATSADSLSSACGLCVTDAQIATMAGAKVTGTVNSATTANNALNLGSVAANQYVVTTDSRMIDARMPLPGSSAYIQSNPANPQSLSSFDINSGHFSGSVRIEGNGSIFQTTPSLSLSSNGSLSVDAPFQPGGRLMILPNGNVGISNGAPAEKLDVTGNVKVNGNGLVTGNLTFPNGTLAGSSTFSGLSTEGLGLINLGINTGHEAPYNPNLPGLWLRTDLRAPRGFYFIKKVDTDESLLMRIAEDGSVYVGQEPFTGGQPGSLTVYGNSLLNTLTVANGLTVNVLGTGGGQTLCHNAAAQISTCSSSARYKTNINSFSPGLDLIRRLRPVSFNWKANNLDDFGLVAEEVAEVEPLLVTHNEKGEVEGVKYDRVAVVLINAVKEQQAQIEALKKLLCKADPQAELCIERQER